MAFFHWKDYLNTSISSVDEQHRKIIDLMNRIYESITETPEEISLQRILDELTEYSRIHFQDEEQLMREADYPGLEKHQADHRNFISKIIEFHQALQYNEPGLALEMLSFLGDWLFEHISVSDKKFVPYYFSHLKNTQPKS